MVYILVRLNSAKTEMSSNSKVGQKIRFQKILVAIDGSDASMDAADYAISISKEYGTELCALHVIRADVDLFGVHTDSEYTITMKKEGEKYLDEVKLKGNEKNIQIKPQIIATINIAGGIVDFAEENNIDLIVVGTRGSSGFKKLLLGSVAAHTITYAHCPVMVVK
jgi:nucleotide-binding universal stress UspA family protein